MAGSRGCTMTVGTTVQWDAVCHLGIHLYLGLGLGLGLGLDVGARVGGCVSEGKGRRVMQPWADGR